MNSEQSKTFVTVKYQNIPDFKKHAAHSERLTWYKDYNKI